jgi:hypothetical protein
MLFYTDFIQVDYIFVCIYVIYGYKLLDIELSSDSITSIV